jgi:hypothetical protein
MARETYLFAGVFSFQSVFGLGVGGRVSPWEIATGVPGRFAGW